jgi:hypothetical protein
LATSDVTSIREEYSIQAINGSEAHQFAGFAEKFWRNCRFFQPHCLTTLSEFRDEIRQQNIKTYAETLRL